MAEGEARARALEAPPVPAAAWAATALGLRREPVASLGTDVRTFETSLEMLEGTANCVARRAVGETAGRTAKRLREAGERRAELLLYRPVRPFLRVRLPRGGEPVEQQAERGVLFLAALVAVLIARSGPPLPAPDFSAPIPQ